MRCSRLRGARPQLWVRPAQRRGLAAVVAGPQKNPQPLGDGISRVRNVQYNARDREHMAEQRRLWMVETLGLSDERAERYAMKMPPVWAQNLPLWTDFALKNFDFSEEECMEIFRKDPALLGGQLELAEQVAEWMTSSGGPGWNTDQVRRVFQKYPALFNKSPEKFQATLDWIRNEYCDPVAGQDYLIRIPLFLQASLHGRIRPRYDMARKHGIHPGKVTLTHIYQSPDTLFAGMLGIT